MAFASMENYVFVLEHDQTQSGATVQLAFVGGFHRKARSRSVVPHTFE